MSVTNFHADSGLTSVTFFLRLSEPLHGFAAFFV